MRRMVHPHAPGFVYPRNELHAAVFRKSGWVDDDPDTPPAPAEDDDNTTEAGGDLPTDSEKE